MTIETKDLWAGVGEDESPEKAEDVGLSDSERNVMLNKVRENNEGIVRMREAYQAQSIGTSERIPVEPSEASQAGREGGAAAVYEARKNRKNSEKIQSQKNAEYAQMLSVRQSLNDPSSEGRTRELAERGQWLRTFAEKTSSAPDQIGMATVGLLISYIEEFKKNKNTSEENKRKIDGLVVSIKKAKTESSEGRELLQKAALGFAEQYKRLSERERLAAEGYSRNERLEMTSPSKKTSSSPVSINELAARKVKNGVRGWFSRVKDRVKQEAQNFTRRMK